MVRHENHYDGEAVDCLNGRARLGYLPYRLHIAVRYGEAQRDMALALAGYKGYAKRKDELRKTINELAGVIAGWGDENEP